MFDDFHGEDHIEDGALGQKVLGGHAAIIDGKACGRRMILGDFDIARCRIDRSHLCPEPRERF